MRNHEDLEAENAKLTRYVGIMFIIIILCVPLLFIFYSRCEHLQNEVENLQEELNKIRSEAFLGDIAIAEFSTTPNLDFN